MAYQLNVDHQLTQTIAKTKNLDDEIIKKAKELFGIKTRKPLSNEHKQKISNANKGKKQSVETRIKISNVRKGHKIVVLPKDDLLPEQIKTLKQFGVDIGLVATIAIKQKYQKLIKYITSLVVNN